MRGGWPLTGRSEEIRLIDAAISGSVGYGGIVIAGQAGVGKTRLAREVLASAENRGAIVRWAVATASARSVPLGAFAEWTQEPGKDPLQLVRGVIAAMTDNDDGTEVVVGVDDAHLLDDLSAFVLHQVVLRRAAKVIVTIRREQPVPDAVSALWKDRHLDLLELQQLSERESAALVREVLGGPLDRGAARRLWALTRGNVLYLRNVVEQELAAGRLQQEGELWDWTGDPVASASLVDLIETRIGVLPPAVGEVIDLLAVGEPLDLDLLAHLTGPAAIEDADDRGLIAVECRGTRVEVRVSHPLYGEVRRTCAAPTRLRRLRGLVAQGLATSGETDMRTTVRRGALSLDSDLPPDPRLYTEAACGALWLSDLTLAERLADAATAGGGGIGASYIRAQALSWLSRGDEADTVLANISTAGFSGPEVARHTFLRAINLLWTMGRPADARALADAVARDSSADDGLACLTAFRVVWAAAMGRPRESIAMARSLELSHLPDVVAAVTSWAIVAALGDAGQVDEAVSAAHAGFELVSRSFEAAQMKYVLADAYIGALILAGRIDEAQQSAQQLLTQAEDLPGPSARLLGSAIAGRAALGAGLTAPAKSLLGAAIAGLTARGDSNGFCYRYQLDRTQALAVSGDDAVAAMAEAEVKHHPSWGLLEPAFMLVRAWVSATQGVVTEAIATARAAAAQAAEHGQYGVEVLCLQAAAQFGDKTTAVRSAELAASVDGPRADVVATYAQAVAAGDSDGLRAASLRFEAIGDRLAAADAAAQAAQAYSRRNLRGSAATAAARAAHLARECGDATTPALRALQQPSPLTEREREIITLVKQGLSNRQIAERLTVSVRTVEGHLYRAATKTGATSRTQLAAMMSDD